MQYGSRWYLVKMKIDILITGTGSLAEEVLLSIIKLAPKKLNIYILGRNLERLRWLKLIIESQSALLGKSINLDYSVIQQWNCETLISILSNLEPELILHTASVQSAWMLKHENKWNSLVKKHGYGLTTLLQCHLALILCRSLESLGRSTPVINASYPDVTNYILYHLGFPVIAGIGNISIMDTLLRGSKVILDAESLFFYAHHYHISQLIQGNRDELPKVCYQGNTQNFFDFFSAPFRLPSDESLNKLTGNITALQILSYLGLSDPYIGHMPGVDGLLGGYPIRISYKEIKIRPSYPNNFACIQQEFKELSTKEGVIVDSDSICFSDDVMNDLYKLSIIFPNRVYFSDFNKQSHIFLNIKEKLS